MMFTKRNVAVGAGAALLLAVGWVPSGRVAGVGTGIAVAEAAQPQPQPRTVCLAFQTIEIGEYSQFGDYCGTFFEVRTAPGSVSPCYADVAHPAFEAIIRDQCTFEDFWVQHSTAPAPVVDFSRDLVIAVVAGAKPGGCNEIEITAISSSGCGNKIHIRERNPCAGGEFCSRALTDPFHIIKVCRDLLPWEVPTCFEHRLSQQPACNLFKACAIGIDD